MDNGAGRSCGVSPALSPRLLNALQSSGPNVTPAIRSLRPTSYVTFLLLLPKFSAPPALPLGTPLPFNCSLCLFSFFCCACTPARLLGCDWLGCQVSCLERGRAAAPHASHEEPLMPQKHTITSSLEAFVQTGVLYRRFAPCWSEASPSGHLFCQPVPPQHVFLACAAAFHGLHPSRLSKAPRQLHTLRNKCGIL